MTDEMPDPELDALEATWKALSTVDLDAQERILNWACAKVRFARMVASKLIRQDGTVIMNGESP